MVEFEQPPQLADEQVAPFLNLLRANAPKDVLDGDVYPDFLEHFALTMAQSVWGYVYRAYWDGREFRPLMSSDERRQLARQCRSGAKALRMAMTTGLLQQHVLSNPFAIHAIDRLADMRTRKKDEPTYLSLTDGEERSFIVGTNIARECLARRTDTVIWPRVERKYLVQPTHGEHADALNEDARRLAGELEGRAILLEATDAVLSPPKGSQDTGARYMFATCIAAYHNAVRELPSAYPERRPPLFACIEGLLRVARNHGRKWPRGASRATFASTLQALRTDMPTYAGFQILDVRGRVSSSIVDTPPAERGAKD